MASLPTTSAAVGKFSSPSAVAAAPRRRLGRVFFNLTYSKPVKLNLRPSKMSKICSNRTTSLKAQLNEVVGGSSNQTPPAESKLEIPAPKENEQAATPSSEEAISDFMTQVASLVKLVDSKDIVELQLKQLDCELVIRKKEALPQPLATAPVATMHQPPPHMAMPSQSPPSAPAASPPPAPPSAPLPASPSAPKQPKSSHPPLISPMAGTFYRRPGPGSPPFVNVGDKVKKGQVLCIIEAMKLMNEIEADQAGTIVEILAEDTAPVGIEQPLFVIEP